jgi:hypothetical protein
MEDKRLSPQMTKYRPIAKAGIRCVHAGAAQLGRWPEEPSAARTPPLEDEGRKGRGTKRKSGLSPALSFAEFRLDCD